MNGNLGDDPFGEPARQRLREQISAMRTANGGHLAADTPDDADYHYLYDPRHVLVRTTDVADLARALGRRSGVLAGTGQAMAGLAGTGLTRYALPRRRTSGVADVPYTLGLLDSDSVFGADRATPDHYLHVAKVGGSCCPATEPDATATLSPSPPLSAIPAAGQGVRVSVVDTGWHPPAGASSTTPWLQGVTGDDENNGPNLRAYAGHGTFIAGVIRCRAPQAAVRVERFAVGAGGVVRESDLVEQLIEGLDWNPHVINLSAGTTTRRNRPLLSFDWFYKNWLRRRGDQTVLIAAAGNHSSPLPFWPASFAWATGVGSLDVGGTISSFSNHTDAPDVYALGQDIVNAFPNGTYVCQETPNKGTKRNFTNGLATWSGTSFSAPIVAGLIAAEMKPNVRAAAARDAVLARAVPATDVRIGSYLALRPPY